MKKPALLLLAAGMGSRYGGLKQLDPVGPNGEILMDYSIFDALRAGFGKVVFVIRRDIEDAFKKAIGSRYDRFVEVDYAFQSLDDLPAGYTVPAGREKPWGTGQAAYAARNVLKEPFALLNADDFYGADGFCKIADALQNSPDCCMCGFKLKNTLSENGSVSRGVCTADANGFLAQVVENTKIGRENGVILSTMEDGSKVTLAEDTVVSMNMWGFQPIIFNHLESLFSEFLAKRGTELKSEFYIPSVAAELIKRNVIKVKLLTSEASWLGITYREDKPMVATGLKALHQSGVYPEKLF